MDAAGRIVLPKRVREQAGFRPGQALRFTCQDGRVEIEPATVAVEVTIAADGLPILAAREPMPTLTVDEVQATLDEVRARHD